LRIQVVQLPAGGLRVVEFEMGEKFSIVQSPKATGIIGHAVEGAREVVMTDHISMGSLVRGVEAEQVRAGG
jgi:hypothetical protein